MSDAILHTEPAPVRQVSDTRRRRPPSGTRWTVRPTTVLYRTPDDRIVKAERADVRTQILSALVSGPLQKWQLREALHIPEHVIFRELKTLRADGAIKAVGLRRESRRWALATWQPPPPHPKGQKPAHADEATVIRSPKPAPVADSWWTRPLTWDQFSERATKGADV